MDLVIKKADGWEELDDAWATLVDAQADVSGFWKAVGAGDYDKAIRVLVEAGWEFDEPPIAVRIVSEPDDILGERNRVWIRTKRS